MEKLEILEKARKIAEELEKKKLPARVVYEDEHIFVDFKNEELEAHFEYNDADGFDLVVYNKETLEKLKKAKVMHLADDLWCWY